MNAPRSTKVSLLPALPSCQPNPKVVWGCAAATSGLITLSVKALTKLEKAKATTNPTATVITSPRITKSLNPLNTRATSRQQELLGRRDTARKNGMSVYPQL